MPSADSASPSIQDGRGVPVKGCSTRSSQETATHWTGEAVATHRMPSAAAGHAIPGTTCRPGHVCIYHLYFMSPSTRDKYRSCGPALWELRQ